MNESDEQHLRRAIELAAAAREAGDMPFGSLLVGPAGDVLAEDRNTVLSDRDVTAHPELKLARWAARELTARRRARHDHVHELRTVPDVPRGDRSLGPRAGRLRARLASSSTSSGPLASARRTRPRSATRGRRCSRRPGSRSAATTTKAPAYPPCRARKFHLRAHRRRERRPRDAKSARAGPDLGLGERRPTEIARCATADTVEEQPHVAAAEMGCVACTGASR